MKTLGYVGVDKRGFVQRGHRGGVNYGSAPLGVPVNHNGWNGLHMKQKNAFCQKEIKSDV